MERVKVSAVVLWALSVGTAAFVVIAWVIPGVATVVEWAGTSSGGATLVWLGVWAVCGLIAFGIASLFVESVGARVVIALLGAVALVVMLVYVVLSAAFSGGGRR